MCHSGWDRTLRLANVMALVFMAILFSVTDSRSGEDSDKLKDIDFSAPYECKDHYYSRRQDKTLNIDLLYRPETIIYGSDADSVLPSKGNWILPDEEIKQYPLIMTALAINTTTQEWGIIVALKSPDSSWKNTFVYLSNDMPLLIGIKHYRQHVVDIEEPGWFTMGKVHFEDTLGRIIHLNFGKKSSGFKVIGG